MRCFHEPFRLDVLIRRFDETFWLDVWWDSLMRRFDEMFQLKFCRDILIAFKDFWQPVMTIDDLWYGDDANGMQCYQKCPNLGFSPNLDLCTEIFLICYDFSYQDQHWDYGFHSWN